MQIKNLPSKSKIDIAIIVFNKLLKFTLPNHTAVSDWSYVIGSGHSWMGYDRFIFSHIYSCHHSSYKVRYMKNSVINFKNMIIYLFCKRVQDNFLTRKKFDNIIGFPDPIEGIELERVFHKDSLTYKYSNDIVNCNPKIDDTGWQNWEEHHLALMGGVFWSLISSISLLGMLKRYINKDYKQDLIMSYPEGTTKYILEDINYDGLNNKGEYK